MSKHRVLIVDDSPVVRRMIAASLAPEPDIEVVGMAGDPYQARDLIQQCDPDILTLDIEMPRMDGLTFLKILMEKHPMPVIVLSSLSQANSKHAMLALEQGAADVLSKPHGSHSLGETGSLLANRIRTILSHGRVGVSRGFLRTPEVSEKVIMAPKIAASAWDSSQIILMGASTGGPPALKTVLQALPAEIPGICLVQHMPAFITQAFAERLDADCLVRVKEARSGDFVERGQVLLAPGDYHMTLNRQGGRFQVQLDQSPKVRYQRPAVDVLFRSALPYANKGMLAVILTGMGSDGADGMRELREKGVHTIAQDEASSVVYGMPRAAAECGGVKEVLPLGRIAEALVRYYSSNAR